MAYNRKILSLIFISIMLSCNTQKKANDSYENFPMKVTNEYKKVKSWTRFDKPEFGTLYTYNLKKPKIIQGIPCKGKFDLDKDGNLYAFTLSEDHSFYGNNIPKGSYFEAGVDNNMERSGYMIYLSKDCEYQCYLTSSRKRFKQWHLSINNDGKLKRFMPVKDIEIDGLPVSNKNWVDLYPDGHLKRCSLSKDFKVDGMLYKKGSVWND